MTNDDDDHGGDDDDTSVESSDEALLEMLGLSSLKEVVINNNADENNNNNNNNNDDEEEENKSSSRAVPNVSNNQLDYLRDPLVREQYSNESIFLFPEDYSISAEYMRILTEELCRGKCQADRSYENIKIWKDGEISERRTLTRLENFVDTHTGWNELCHVYLRRIVSVALGEEMVLFKEKLNLKPPGGSGFAPHLDSPSLRIAMGCEGPKTFCTVMVAIDDMTTKNGCLRICKDNWSEDNCCNVIQPDTDGSPDAGGRAGAIPPEIAEKLTFTDITCKGGTVLLFNGWAPHRSSANVTPFPRRAIFLTYNPKSEGDFHKRYYERMEKLRNEFREKIGLESRKQSLEDEINEKNALSSIPNK
jgi:hypothetical protein